MNLIYYFALRKKEKEIKELNLHIEYSENIIKSKEKVSEESSFLELPKEAYTEINWYKTKLD